MRLAATTWMHVLPPGYIVSIMMFVVFRLLPPCKWELCLHREKWWFHTDVSEKSIGPIFEGLLGPSTLMVLKGQYGTTILW